jgi:NAD(P)-dependent dehydrogenase (short-subunit alcohol dehydrogenase family)
MAKQIILVTGGNNGIGFTTCSLLAAQAGMHVIMGSRSAEKGEAAMQEILQTKPAGSISTVQLDINSDASISAAVAEVGAKHGHVDTLINNAGVGSTESSRAAFRDALDTNCISPAQTTAAFLPLLRKSAAARVVYVTSVLGSASKIADPNDRLHSAMFKAYRVSKAALNMLALADQVEYEKDGVRVFIYCPGYVVSDLAGMRQAKIDAGVPTPEKSARGLLAICQGGQDANVGQFLHAASIVDGEPFHPW